MLNNTAAVLGECQWTAVENERQTHRDGPILDLTKIPSRFFASEILSIELEKIDAQSLYNLVDGGVSVYIVFVPKLESVVMVIFVLLVNLKLRTTSKGVPLRLGKFRSW